MLEPSKLTDFGQSTAPLAMLVGETMHTSNPTLNSLQSPHSPHSHLLKPIRRRLEQLEVRNPKTARWIAKLIPAQCPFERDVKFRGRTIAHIPPLCKLNPLYEELVMLRFRALCYLADECGEDIRSYC